MSFRSTGSIYLYDLLHLVYPHTCMVCRMSLTKEELDICFSCIDSFPKTNYHLQSDNPVVQHFWGRVPLVHAASYLYIHSENVTQEVLHLLKYKGKKRIGIKMGRLYGYLLMENGSLFRDIDMIVPVPLHPNREMQRGYNQCDYFAAGLSQVMGIPYYPHAIRRIKENKSQTQKSRYDRWENVEGIFELATPALVSGKHILLVDDVVTTGATIESCIAALLLDTEVRVSVATIATAGR